MAENKNIYSLSRAWFDFSYENPELIKPNHTALYFFCIEHCNRLGWKEKFGLPTTMAKEAVGIKSYNTYKNTLNDLVGWKFIKMIEVSKNQYSANIIALSFKAKALDKALDKALIKHASKQSESTSQSIGSVNKQYTSIQVYKLTKYNSQVKDFLETLPDDSISLSPQKTEGDYKKQLLLSIDSPEIKETDNYQIAIAFHSLFVKNLSELGINNSSLEKAKGIWVDHIRMMIDIDKRTPEEIREVFDFLKVDVFWKENIRSTSKLREKFETLLIKSRKNEFKKPTPNDTRDGAELKAIIERHTIGLKANP